MRAAAARPRLRLRGRPVRPGRQPRPGPDPRAGPLLARGRRVDPATGAIYLTEDAAAQRPGLPLVAARGFRPGRGALRRLGPADGVLAAMRCTDGAGPHVRRSLPRHRDRHRYTSSGCPCPTGRPQRSDPQAARRRRRHPRPQAGGRLVGTDGGAYIVTSFARDDEPGVSHDGQVWFRTRRPLHADAAAAFRAAGEEGQHRRPGQHLGVAVGWVGDRRGRRGQPAPRRGHRGRPRPIRSPAPTAGS